MHCLPLHDHQFNRQLRRRARYLNPFCGTSVDEFIAEVRSHFGEKVALYFAFVQHLTTWMVIPALVGLIIGTSDYISDRDSRDFLTINPKGYIPALEMDDGTVLTENQIILTYIAEESGNHQELGEIERGSSSMFHVLHYCI